MIRISRVYSVDGTETCIQAEDPDAQAALRLLDRAAEQVGAAPTPLTFTGAAKAPSRGGGSRKPADTSAVTAKGAEQAPVLPPGVATAFPPVVPPGAQGIPPSYGAPPPAQPQYLPPDTPPQPSVSWGPEPPPPTGSHVGLAPSPPPAYAPPPPPDARGPLVQRVRDAQQGVIDLVGQKQPSWLDSVAQTMNSILSEHGADVQAMSEEQLTTVLGHFRRYEDTLKKHIAA